jgi:dTMP kinase
MHNRKFFFIVFEGIEGSGKSYQSRKLYTAIKKIGLSVILTREPGGTKSAEEIREIILKDYFNQDSKEKFDKYTDTLLYLAARNEHIQNKIKPAISKKKIVICDRFIDSTFAYQVYGKGVNKNFVDLVHKYILGNIKPDMTFILKVNMSKALQRLKKRAIKKNRYDKFSKNFYIKAQKAFIKIAKKNKKKYYIFDNSEDDKNLEKSIFKLVRSKLIK